MRRFTALTVALLVPGLPARLAAQALDTSAGSSAPVPTVAAARLEGSIHLDGNLD